MHGSSQLENLALQAFMISEPAQRLSFYGSTAKIIVQGVPHHYKA
jgi:hypothetical protein